MVPAGTPVWIVATSETHTISPDRGFAFIRVPRFCHLALNGVDRLSTDTALLC
jgi:hypothetical protein